MASKRIKLSIEEQIEKKKKALSNYKIKKDS